MPASFVDKVYCPKCEAANPGDTVRCTGCNYPMAAAAIIDKSIRATAERPTPVVRYILAGTAVVVLGTVITIAAIAYANREPRFKGPFTLRRVSEFLGDTGWRQSSHDEIDGVEFLAFQRPCGDTVVTATLIAFPGDATLFSMSWQVRGPEHHKTTKSEAFAFVLDRVEEVYPAGAVAVELAFTRREEKGVDGLDGVHRWVGKAEIKDEWEVTVVDFLARHYPEDAALLDISFYGPIPERAEEFDSAPITKEQPWFSYEVWLNPDRSAIIGTVTNETAKRYELAVFTLNLYKGRVPNEELWEVETFAINILGAGQTKSFKVPLYEPLPKDWGWTIDHGALME
jgi:hypothetical protein